ncbi:uncharacterized protein CIMG_12655 [Coccidioides immitis RS]|uniref:Uncharacterized protein n=1 Tax=Coccidioides immitis (strain RS) TaxID=246410 RepID=J3KLN6_COCIM|nr:uncharacterized protein CIMG_12655 [Coccidioides immitis RS]EAS37231.3 hypothetical protein CIMG_12655 [Coccidioides immitis RS]
MTEDLLLMHACQIEQQDENILEAAHHQLQMHTKNKKYFNDIHNIQTNPLQSGDLVLLHNIKEEQNIVKSVNQELGSYHLEELDSTEIKESIAGSRLKKYLIRSGMKQLSDSPADSDEEMENVPQKYATRSQPNIPSSSSSDVSFLDRRDDQGQSESKNENNQEEMK